MYATPAFNDASAPSFPANVVSDPMSPSAAVAANPLSGASNVGYNNPAASRNMAGPGQVSIPITYGLQSTGEPNTKMIYVPGPNVTEVDLKQRVRQAFNIDPAIVFDIVNPLAPPPVLPIAFPIMPDGGGFFQPHEVRERLRSGPAVPGAPAAVYGSLPIEVWGGVDSHGGRNALTILVEQPLDKAHVDRQVRRAFGIGCCVPLHYEYADRRNVDPFAPIGEDNAAAREVAPRSRLLLLQNSPTQWIKWLFTYALLLAINVVFHGLAAFYAWDGRRPPYCIAFELAAVGVNALLIVVIDPIFTSRGLTINNWSRGQETAWVGFNVVFGGLAVFCALVMALVLNLQSELVYVLCIINAACHFIALVFDFYVSFSFYTGHGYLLY